MIAAIPKTQLHKSGLQPNNRTATVVRGTKILQWWRSYCTLERDTSFFFPPMSI